MISSSSALSSLYQLFKEKINTDHSTGRITEKNVSTGDVEIALQLLHLFHKYAIIIIISYDLLFLIQFILIV